MLKLAMTVLFLLLGVSRAADLGTVAFIKDNAVYVSKVNSNVSRRIPGSNGAIMVSFSPDQKYLVFFNLSSLNTQGYYCLAPFTSCRVFRLSSSVAYGLIWNGSKNQFFLGQQNASRLLSLPDLQTKTYKFFPNSVSSDAKTLAYSTNSEIRLVVAGKQRTVFAIPKSQNALRWAFGGLGLSDDGRQLYFASNSGAGVDGSGTTRWRWFRVNTTGGTPKALKLPEFSGRIPDTVEISSDKQKMLFGFSNQNSSTLHVLSLEQNELRTMAQVGNGALTASFSPDSSLIAVGYGEQKGSALVNNVQIVNLLGVVLRNIPGGSQCTW
jgi:WD40-like Beta Propeller Repeat